VGNQGFKPSQSGLQKLLIMILKAILYVCLGVKRMMFNFSLNFQAKIDTPYRYFFRFK